MTEDTRVVTEPEDDAIVVHDEAAEEKAHEDLVADVTKMLDQSGDELEKTAETGAKPEAGEEKPSKAEEPKGEEPKDEKPAELSDALQARAEGAGISKDLAQHLHETGHLEETLAGFDRALIERFQSKETDGKPERREPAEGREKAPQKEPADQDVPDPDAYDKDLWDEDAHKDLVKRDAHSKRRIDALEATVAELLEERQIAFETRFDGMVDGLGHKDLFGTGQAVPEAKQANRDKLFKAYQGVCLAYDVNPNDCNPEWGKRALAAMFPEEVFKKAQRQTVDRLRDAERKFLSSPKSRGAPPAKEATEEETHQQLVSEVDAYLKKQGVQMSGV